MSSVRIQVLAHYVRRASIALVLSSLLVPTAAFGLFVVRLGVVPAITVAIDQSPPLTVNLTIAARIAAVPLDHTFRWIGWLLVSMAVALMLVVIFREIALWLPRALDIG